MGSKRIGLLTGGGDCPGLNAVIRAVVFRAASKGTEVVGLRHGWRGLLNRETQPLDRDAVRDILPRGGTILGTSRTNPRKEKDGLTRCRASFHDLGLSILIAVGGEDTLGVAASLHQQGLPVIGVPKTIDNDLQGTDVTFGFDTAVQIASDALDRLHTTAASHERTLVVEIMGRHAGWIALMSGLSGSADAILIPEQPVELEWLASLVKKKYERGPRYAIIAVSEGAKLPVGEVAQEAARDAFGHVRLGGIGERLTSEIEKRTGFETRLVVLGHLQRGGTPTAFDRILGTRFGVHACDLALEGRSGVMVALQGTQIVSVSLQEAVASLRTVDAELYQLSSTFFG
ncbi:MAG: 6-phosphofructokinase [Acidobacteriota bacterium]